MEGAIMNKGRKAWNNLYTLLEGSELTADTYLMRLEIISNLKKSHPTLSDLEIGMLLLVIADSNLRDLANKNG
jgi:hypothetical protein